jgi:hypothetical protein
MARVAEAKPAGAERIASCFSQEIGALASHLLLWEDLRGSIDQATFCGNLCQPNSSLYHG